MPKKKKSKNKVIPLDVSGMAEPDRSKELEGSEHDIDPRKSIEIIQDIFKGRVDPDVVAMVFSECEFNVDQAVETLFTLLDDTITEAVCIESKSAGAYSETYASGCSSSDDERDKNRDSSLDDWPTLQSACNFKSYHTKNKKHSAKNAPHHTSLSKPYVTSSSSSEILTNSVCQRDAAMNMQDECIQAVPGVDSSSTMYQDQNSLLPQSLDKTITDICKNYASSIQQSSVEYCQEINDKLVENLPKLKFGNSVLDNQHMFIVPKLATTPETISHTSSVALSNLDILQQTPNFLKCLNQSSIETKESALNSIFNDELMNSDSSDEKNIQVRATNSNISARETVSAYMKIGKKLLVVLRGLPGSGKSTLAWLLKSEFSGSVFSTDDFFVTNGKYSMDFSAVSEAHDWNRKRAEAAMANGEFLVIIDNTNIESWEIKPYIALGLKYGYFMEILEPETSWKFNINQLAKRNTHGVSKTKITRMLERYEHNISLGDIIDEINSKVNDSLMVTDQGNFSTDIVSGISAIYSCAQKDERQERGKFNARSVNFGVPSLCSEKSIANESHPDEVNGNDNFIAEKEGGAASADYGVIGFEKNDRIEIGEKNLCLDELIGLLYESEESLSHHTSLSCSSQDVSAWEAITELDDDFLWTSDTLPAVTSNKNELSEIDETNEYADDMKLVTENISETANIQSNESCHKTSSAKSPSDDKNDNEVCTNAKNEVKEEISSKLYGVLAVSGDRNCVVEMEEFSIPVFCTDETHATASSNAYSESGIDGSKLCSISLVKTEGTFTEVSNSVDKNSVGDINELGSIPVVSTNKEHIQATRNVSDEAAGDTYPEILNSIHEVICPTFSWKDSVCTGNNESLICCNELLEELKINDDANFDISTEDESNTRKNDSIESGNSLLAINKQNPMFSDTSGYVFELKDVPVWNDTVVENSDWDSDRVDNNSSCKMEPKPQRQRKSKLKKEQIVMKHEEDSGNNSKNLFNQESTFNLHYTGSSGNGCNGQSKGYWTRSNKKSKVAARLNYGLENVVNTNESHFYPKDIKDVEQKRTSCHDSACLQCSIVKEDHATQVSLEDFLLLQGISFKSSCDRKNSEISNLRPNEPLVCNEISEDLHNAITPSYCNIIINNKAQNHSLLECLKCNFPSVPEQELQYVLDYCNCDLREAVLLLLRYGFFLTKEMKEFVFPSTVNFSHQGTQKNIDCRGLNVTVPQVFDTTKSLENVKISSVINCPSCSSSLGKRVPVTSNSPKLELRLDTAVAQQLQQLFGPVGCNASEDLSNPDDRTVVIDMEVAKMLHHCWANSQRR